MNATPLSQLKADSVLKHDLYLDPRFLLLCASAPVTQELIKALQKWEFAEILSAEEEASARPAVKVSGTFENVTEFDSIINDQKAQEKKESSSFLEEALSKAQKDAGTGQGTEQTRLHTVQSVYNEYMEYIKKVYTHYATHKQLDIKEISETVKGLCVYIKDNRRYMLRITPSIAVRDKEFLISHSMRSTVLAITIAQQIHMPLTQMVELGIACILHEIGMIRLPPQLYITDRPLSAQERAKIAQHPLFSYQILKEANFPVSIQMGVLDHHEKQNGTGYPRKIDSTKISVYAKIIAVACSFEAITTPRQYKEAKTTYDAMVEMLKNEEHAYDDTVIKALLYSLSLYPIGAYVYLANGKVAQVVDVNPSNPRNPMVQIPGEKDANGNLRNIQSNDSDLKIVRVLSKTESEDAVKRFSPEK